MQTRLFALTAEQRSHRRRRISSNKSENIAHISFQHQMYFEAFEIFQLFVVEPR